MPIFCYATVVKRNLSGGDEVRRLWEAPLVRFVREMVEIYFDKHVARTAAELAYWLILSVFPLLICVNAVLGVLQVDVSSVLSYLRPFVPPTLLGVVSEYLNYITNNQSSTLIVAGATMTVLFASAAVRALMDIMNELYGRRGYAGVMQVVASVIFSLLLLAAIYLSIVVVLTGNWFFHLLERYLPFHWPVATWDWQWIKYLVLFGVVFLLVTLIYLMAAIPMGKPRPPVFLGALLASAALVAASMIFSVFISMSSRYSLIYGSLASVIILLLWLYLCGNVLILGNVFNCVRYTRKKEKKISKNT